MGNFMCQINWTMGCPDIWPNVILGVSVRVFLDEISIHTGRLSKADCSPFWLPSEIQTNLSLFLRLFLSHKVFLTMVLCPLLLLLVSDFIHETS